VVFACPYRCKGCWARQLINKFPKGNLGKKYSGPYRIHERAINQKFKAEDFVAVQFMSDIGAPGIPDNVITEVLDRIRTQPSTFLLQTKNPEFYKTYALSHSNFLPENALLGFTMETDTALIGQGYTEAPDVWTRYLAMRWLQKNLPNNRFVSVEPILAMSDPQRFADDLTRLEPWGVAVGYDNYSNHFPEPKLEKTEALIGRLEENGIQVFRKNIRRAWNE